MYRKSSQSTPAPPLWRTDLRASLFSLKAQALGMHGLGDYVVDPHQADVIAAQILHAQVERFEGSRHFPMLEEPEWFNRTLLDSVMR